MRLANAIGLPVTVTLAPGATAIDVTGINEQVLLVGDGGGNTITSITGAVVGDWVIIEFADSLIASISASAAKFDGGERFIPKAGDMIYLFHDGTNLREIARTRAARTPNAITLAPGAAAIDVSAVPSADGRKTIKLTGDAGTNSVTSITGLASGMSLRIQFVDGLITLKAAIGTLAGGLDYTSGAGQIIDFFYDGSTVMEISRASLAVTVTPQAPTAITLGAGAATIDVTATPVVNGLKLIKLTGDASGNTITSITGFGTNNVLGIIFADAKVTLAAALGKLATGDVFISQTDAFLLLHNDGTTIREEARNIPSFAPTAITLGTGATALATAAAPCNRGVKQIALTGDAGGNAVASITGMITGEILILRFIDALVNFTTAAAKFEENTAYYPLAGDTMILFYDGTNLRELSRRAALHTPTAITLAPGATALALASVPVIGGVKKIKLTGDAGLNSLTSITGLSAGDSVEITFVDGLVTLTTTAAKLQNNANYLPAANDVITLSHDGTNIKQTALTRQAGPLIATASSATPTGTASATLVMMGLAVAFTPKLTGRVKITITGMMGNGAIGDGASCQISYGTGAAPANAAAVTGTQVGSIKNMVAATAAGKQGFAACWIVTGLTIGTAIWVDLALKAVTGNTATVYDVDVVVEEI